MAHVIWFTTAKFDISNETPNRINPIPGESVLNWVREKLAATQYQTTEPETEDWGWYVDVTGNNSRYMVGASGEIDDLATDVVWAIQVHKLRTLSEKLFGRNKMSVDDPLSALLESFIRGDASFKDIDIDNTPD